MANNVSKVNTISIGSIGKINGQNDSDLAKLNGEEFTYVPPVWSGTRAVLMGAYTYSWTPTYGSAGSSVYLNEVGYKTLDSDSNTSDWGDLNSARGVATGSGSNGTRTVQGGGNTASGFSDSIDILTAASTGTISDHGNLALATYTGCWDGASNGTTLLFIGGWKGGSFPYATDMIQEMTIASSGAADNGADLRYWGYGQCASMGDSKTLMLEEEFQATGKEEISYHNFVSGADATDASRVATVPTSTAGMANSSTRAVIAGGAGDSVGGGTVHDKIQVFTVDSSADSEDEADLVQIIYRLSGTSDKTRGEFYGGTGSGGEYMQNDIQKIAIASISNAADCGDLAFSTGADTYTHAGSGSGIASQTAS